MTEMDLILRVLKEAALVISDYFEAGQNGDPKATLDRLIDLLQGEELGATVDRIEAGRILAMARSTWNE